MPTAAKLDARIKGEMIEVTTNETRRRIVVRPSNQNRYLAERVYERHERCLMAVPITKVSASSLLNAFKSAGVPAANYEEIRKLLLGLPHMRQAAERA